MPTWSGILKELTEYKEKKGAPLRFDAVRRHYLHGLSQYTGRDTILYASSWIQKPAHPDITSINDEDIQALMEVSADLSGQNLDLILHSPGGTPEAAEAIVSYLRSRFKHIRVIVPQLAMSAATMIACAANEIIMGKHSFLGPTDPQIVLMTPLGLRAVPAQSVIDQFDRAQEECSKPEKLSSWLPMLSQYGPDLLVQCENALNMSRVLVAEWLKEFMFNGDGRQADKVSTWLANHDNFKSHSRHLSRQILMKNGLLISELENDDELQDLSLSVFHATTHTFSNTPTVKLVENHKGKAFIKLSVPPVPPPI